MPAVVSESWIGVWGNAPIQASSLTLGESAGANQTFRFLLHPTIGGNRVRVRFSNFGGSAPVTIGSARIGISVSQGVSVIPSSDRSLTFKTVNSVTIPTGETVVSDPIDLTYSFGQDLAVSMFLPGSFPALSGHSSIVTTNFATASGGIDETKDLTGASFTAKTLNWYLLSGLDAYGDYQGTIVQIGGSTTDGYHSNDGDTELYPTAQNPIITQDHDRATDWLAEDLNKAGLRYGVLNEGILGDTAGPDPANAQFGEDPGTVRFARDVLAQPDVKFVILYLGANDMRGSKCDSAAAVEASQMKMISEAAAAKVKVILATIAPSTFCSVAGNPHFGPTPSASDPFGGTTNPEEAARMAYNSWVLNSGPTIGGVAGIADFNAVLTDPSNPHFMLPMLNSGDNVHPDGFGYSVQAGAVSLSIFK